MCFCDESLTEASSFIGMTEYSAVRHAKWRCIKYRIVSWETASVCACTCLVSSTSRFIWSPPLTSAFILRSDRDEERLARRREEIRQRSEERWELQQTGWICQDEPLLTDPGSSRSSFRRRPPQGTQHQTSQAAGSGWCLVWMLWFRFQLLVFCSLWCLQKLS